jgi:hypothetical protein
MAGWAPDHLADKSGLSAWRPPAGDLAWSQCGTCATPCSIVRREESAPRLAVRLWHRHRMDRQAYGLRVCEVAGASCVCAREWCRAFRGGLLDAGIDAGAGHEPFARQEGTESPVCAELSAPVLGPTSTVAVIY